ncbi:hypothetical protein CVT26_006864 [Gymnopilus dilepis]|uniref:Uncharacterized protein n=1 Tax=Gymnopilus dilepis TaxID=231916 RepID=A0A409W0S9_9AGAR|nr:hypothetical protein CVT26_006864 [Gymnopilus dilepis]
MQVSLQPCADPTVVWSFGLPIRGVQDSIHFLKEQFKFERDTDFAKGKVLAIKLGRNTREVDISIALEHLKDNKSLVLNIACVSITVDKVVWMTDWQRTIQEQLPRDVTTLITVYDSNSRFQETTLLCKENGFSPVIFSSFPVDVLLEPSVREVFSRPGLQTLLLLPPSDPAAFLQNDLGLQAELIRLLEPIKRLKKIRLPLDFSTGIKNIVRVLRDMDGLRVLELGKPTSFNVASLHSTLRLRFDNALLRCLEPFPQLEKLVLDKAFITPSLLAMGDRMFQDKTDGIDGKTVVFQNAARTYHNTPSFLL